MKRRELMTLVGGFIIGLLIGMVLVGSSDSLRESLFGTAGSGAKTEDLTYYQVPLDTAQGWLIQQFPDQGDQIKASVTVLTRLPSVVNFNVDFQAAEEDIQLVLPYAYAALTGIDTVDNIQPVKDDPTVVCLGLDDDPYAGSTLYLYVTMTNTRAGKLDLPTGWDQLDQPNSNVLYWKLLGCFPTQDTTK